MESYPEVRKDQSRVFFLFPFGLPDESDTTIREAMNDILNARLSDLVALPFMPQAVLKALQPADVAGSEEKARKKAENLPVLMQRPIWCVSAARLSKDLHPHIRMLLGEGLPEANAGTESTGFRVPPMFQLSPEAANILTGRWQTRGQGFNVALSESARRRLGLPVDVDARAGIVVETGYLQFFRSGLGIVILECAYRDPPAGTNLAEAILEVNYRLCHSEQAGGALLFWAPSARSDSGIPEQAATFNDIARSLLVCAAPGRDEGSRALIDTIRWATESRIFTYVALQFAGAFASEKTRRIYAHRLCCKYTSDYRVHEERMRATSVSPFDNVLHGVSIEGGCLLVEEDAQVDFLKTYTSKVVRQVYLPLALVSFHELRHLLRLAQESALYVPGEHPTREHMTKLRRLKHHLINFHLFFRFSHASMVSHHNLVHQVWREAFGLDRMLQDVTLDVAEAEAVLSQEETCREAELEHEEQRRWRIWGAVGTWVIVYHSLSLILETWIKKPILDAQVQLMGLKVIGNVASVGDFAAEQARTHHIEIALESLAMIVAVALAVFIYRKKPKGSAGGTGH